MTHTNRKAEFTTRILAAIATSFLICAIPTISQADGWELRTVNAEVPGTREIETGDAEQGIKLSKIYLTRIHGRRKVAVLTNLCIGYIRIGDLDQAATYCDQAAARKNETVVTHNNRGVLNALRGEFVLAQQDFQTAASVGCAEPCESTGGNSKDLPRHVARRNLGAAQARVFAAEISENADQYTVREDH